MSSVLDRSELEQSPLADLHLLANELGVDGFRRLRREELIDAILSRQTGEAAAVAEADVEPAPEAVAVADVEPAPEAVAVAETEPEPDEDAEDRRPRRGRRGGRGRGRARGAAEDGATDEDAGEEE